MTAKTLPGNAGAERQAHLLAYAVAWLRDHAQHKSDLFQIETIGRLYGSLRADLVTVLTRLGIRAESAEDLVTEAAGQALGGWLAKKAKAGLGGLLGKISGG